MLAAGLVPALCRIVGRVATRQLDLSFQTKGDLKMADNLLPWEGETSKELQSLSGAAREAGVENKMFGIFHDAGYKGLYAGLGRDAIKARKNIPPKQQLLDRMDTTELAANQFRMTQARDKLNRQTVKDQTRAINTHHEVGREVRRAIERIGGTMPKTCRRPSTSKKSRSESSRRSPSSNWNEMTRRAVGRGDERLTMDRN